MRDRIWKFLLFMGAIFPTQSGIAQYVLPKSWDDSSIVAGKNQRQMTRFQQRTESFPPRPVDQWQLALAAGTMSVYGDLDIITPQLAYQFHIRKSVGYLVSLRAAFTSGQSSGLSWKPVTNYGNNIAWSDNGYVPEKLNAAGQLIPARDEIFYNYQATVRTISIEALFSLTNISFHRATSKWGAYLLAGVSMGGYKTRVNVTDNSSAIYDFSAINSNGNARKKEVRMQLRKLLDDSYETDAESHSEIEPAFLGGSRFLSLNAGLGLEYRFTKRFNIFLENRLSVTDADLIDGQRWSSYPAGSAILTNGNDWLHSIMFGLGVCIGRKRISSLWKVNPLDYSYSELREPGFGKYLKQLLDDSDGDGVADQFDLESGTPTGCPVDTRGRSKDTDGDGVPDCLDLELITPSHCFPVDDSGRGKCALEDCCNRQLTEPARKGNIF